MGKGKKIKVGKMSKVAISDITDDPFTAAFGGKAVVLLPLIDALTVLAEEVEAVSPSKMNTIAWAVIKDGHVVVADIEEEEEELEPWTEDELAELGASKLREEAKFLKVRLTKTRGGKSGKLNKKTRAVLIEAILEAQVEYFGIEREEKEEEDDDDEEYVPWTRKDLNGAEKNPDDDDDLSHQDLLDIAEDLEIKVTKKMKNEVLKRGQTSRIVEAILDAQEEEEEDGDEDDDDEEDDEEEVALYTKSELKGMSQEELAEVANEWDLVVKKPTKKKLMTAILKFQKEEL